MTLLDRHKDHRAFIRGGPRHVIECHDCGGLKLEVGRLTADPGDPCPQHPGRTTASCGPCRSEQLERTDPPPQREPTASPYSIAAARAALRAAQSKESQ